MVFGEKEILIYEYSNIVASKIDMSDPARPTGNLHRCTELNTGDNDGEDYGEDDGENDRENTDDREDTGDNFIFDEREETLETEDIDVEEFHSSLTNCAITTKPLQVHKPRKRNS